MEANFKAQTFEITVNVEPADAGEVTGEGAYSYGDEVTLTVIPYEEYDYLIWTDENGEILCGDLTYVFTATESLILTVHIGTVGVGEQSNTLLVYPNPASDKLTVESTETLDMIEIFNVMGAKVYSQTNCGNQVEIQTDKLPIGTYLIRLTSDKTTVMKRFVKK